MRVKLWFCLMLFLMPGLADAAKPERGELDTIRGRIESYVCAFNNHEAEALAAHWSEKAEYVHPVTGARIHGRKAICKAFTELFKAEPKLRLNFRYALWTDVLQWVAEQADLSLVMDAPPPATFN